MQVNKDLRHAWCSLLHTAKCFHASTATFPQHFSICSPASVQSVSQLWQWSNRATVVAHLFEGEHGARYSGEVILRQLGHGKPMTKDPGDSAFDDFVNNATKLLTVRNDGAVTIARGYNHHRPVGSYLRVDRFPRPHNVYICGVSSRTRSPTSMSVSGAKLSTSSSPHRFFKVAEGVKVGAT